MPFELVNPALRAIEHDPGKAKPLSSCKSVRRALVVMRETEYGRSCVDTTGAEREPRLAEGEVNRKPVDGESELAMIASLKPTTAAAIPCKICGGAASLRRGRLSQML